MDADVGVFGFVFGFAFGLAGVFFGGETTEDGEHGGERAVERVGAVSSAQEPLVEEVYVAVGAVEPFLFLPRAEFDFVFEEFFEIFRPVAVIFRIRLERGSFKGTLERGEGIARVTEITKTFAFFVSASEGDFWNSFRDWREHELLLLRLLICSGVSSRVIFETFSVAN